MNASAQAAFILSTWSASLFTFPFEIITEQIAEGMMVASKWRTVSVPGKAR